MTPEEYAAVVLDTEADGIDTRIAAAIRDAVLAEREACAAVCDCIAARREAQANATGSSMARINAWQVKACAAAIRARA